MNANSLARYQKRPTPGVLGITDSPIMPWERDKVLRDEWIAWVIESFQIRPCVFGTLVYPRKPHLTDIQKSVRIYTEQVLRRSCQFHPNPLRRIFVAEQTAGEEIRRTRVQPIPLNGVIRHLLFKQPKESESPVVNQVPDIPHIHFLLEVPRGFIPTAFGRLCEERWNRMNRDARNWSSQIAKVETVCDLPAVARYLTKEFVQTQGENIILTHATVLG
jgi:hypothetical protein